MKNLWKLYKVTHWAKRRRKEDNERHDAELVKRFDELPLVIRAAMINAAIYADTVRRIQYGIPDNTKTFEELSTVGKKTLKYYLMRIGLAFLIISLVTALAVMKFATTMHLTPAASDKVECVVWLIKIMSK